MRTDPSRGSGELQERELGLPLTSAYGGGSGPASARNLHIQSRTRRLPIQTIERHVLQALWPILRQNRFKVLPVSLRFGLPHHHRAPRIQPVRTVKRKIVEQDAIQPHLDHRAVLRLQGLQQPNVDLKWEHLAGSYVEPSRE
jgi:hypothetical protein